MSAMGGRLDGLRVVDLFAGSGALGLEMLSRGAEHALFVETARGALATLRANVEALGAGPRATILRMDALAWVDDQALRAWHRVVADPPYGKGYAARLLDAFDRTPFADELWVEHRTDESVPELPGLRSRRYGDTTLSILEATPEADRP